jgi:CRISPR/Cas system-associated exonuclease Cas4 (RecB family)|tara:strand:+ start:536 stop:667 length:132 start_codon:yes stop_codon:yes gene_type:complete
MKEVRIELVLDADDLEEIFKTLQEIRNLLSDIKENLGRNNEVA